MSVDPFEQWLGDEMAQDEIDELLDSAGWGILSMARDDEVYSLPMSFGYTEENIYFAFIRQSPSDKKFEYITEGQNVQLLVTDVESRIDWQSVAVSGPVTSIEHGGDEWGNLLDSLEDNAWFSSDFRLATMNHGLHGFRLDPEAVHGIGL
ncbi:MAG: nitroimidazol reductase NimA-like FMN-containing flavoprotein [Haloarculaceae archaeon]|jgi:nitroimidazol reductase NimA-like FMN-containing flavoprotein (pyridoxamine 5'-phosphate oxidase superfamily)